MALNVAFLWHMHQPLYLDPVREDRLALPWVRLHAVKAYTDMRACLEEKADVRATFNITPSLLLQITAYQRGGTDDFLELSRKPADSLSEADQKFLLTHFFSCHRRTMIAPYPRYAQLLAQRGRNFSPAVFSRIRPGFSTRDLLDLQVWFNLTWVGFSSRNHPLIRSLLRKGRFFSEAEKNELLDFHLKLIDNIIPAYADLWKQQRLEISTSPFFHPILPLLVDTDSARRSNPSAELPHRFKQPDDALKQLESGRDYCRGAFGKTPEGLWPPEGGVSPELIPLIDKAGFSWTASDEAILLQSVNQVEPCTLYQPYQVIINGARVNMVFRHRQLSDLIGRVYRYYEPERAVSDFIARLKSIYDDTRSMSRPPLVSVILDGENPWEYYADGGRGLLRRLYDAIIREPGLELVSIGEYLNEYPPTRALHDLDSGSWINKDFSVWIGGAEENRAWEALGRARRAARDAIKRGGLPDAAVEKAMNAIYAAEGSDWFWWYGDRFTSDYDDEFDRLFRMLLQEAYRNLDLAVPEDLFCSFRQKNAMESAGRPL